MTILAIPTELIQQILTFCHPWDVVAFSRTCHAAYNLVFIPNDQYLWRELFLSNFDDPRKALHVTPNFSNTLDSFDWKGQLTTRMKAELTASDHAEADLTYQDVTTLETFISVIQDALPAALIHEDYLPSRNIQWLERVLRKSRMLDGIGPTPIRDGALARLRSYLPLSFDDDQDEEVQEDLRVRRNRSRAFIYDLRNYHEGNEWGPLMRDGSINWYHIECLIIVVLTNLLELPGLWGNVRPPHGLEATRAYTAPENPIPRDWARVEGTWRRYVCFMDYRDLFAFNYSTIAQGPRHPSFFENPRFREATRLLEVELHLVPLEQLQTRSYFELDDDEEESARDINPLFPTLFFSGPSRGVGTEEGIVEGSVEVRRDGTVWWQFLSTYDGHARWTSNGVQIGNVASAFGVVGVWTSVLHEQADPVGPFWLWKVDKDSPEHTEQLLDYT